MSHGCGCMQQQMEYSILINNMRLRMMWALNSRADGWTHARLPG